MQSNSPLPEQTYLFCLLAADLTINLMERLQGSNVYRQELKNAGNRFYDQLLKMTSKDIALVWGENDDVMYRLMEYNEKLIKNIASLKPEDADVINCMIEKYKQNPDAVLYALEIKMIEA